MVEGVGVAVVNKLDGFQIMVILSIAFAYHLVLKIYSAQNKKMGLRNYVRARVDGEIFDFVKKIELLGLSEGDVGCARIQFELLARTYLMDSWMNSALNDKYRKHDSRAFDEYCYEVGKHTREELITSLLLLKYKFPSVIEAFGADLYDVDESVKRYKRCAMKNIELNPVWWKFKKR